MDDLSGQSIRGYELVEPVGIGDLGDVYRARQPSVKREVAVKVILPELADHPDFIERFEVEAQLVARLEHPFIIPLYEYWRDEDGAFLVMRWMKGGSLRDCLEDGPLDLSHVGQLLEQIGGALAFSHEHGVIHRDIKPENILLDEEENAYLADFGIAKDLSAPGVTKSGKLMGSVDYLSPEQAKGEAITPQTDIYALGVVLYELLTCEHPFPDSTPIQMIQKQLNEPLPPIMEKRPDLPMRVNEIINRATAKAPEDRYPDVDALITDFRQAMAIPEERTAVTELPAFLMEDLSGLRVRDYELRERIGAGGFGAVYRAWQSTVDREVAVKVILPEYADHPDFITRFESEAQLVARLEHPYIIPLYEYWRDETGAYLAMRILKGGSLRDCVERGPFDLSELDQLLDQIGGALAFSHDHGVIHRDLKPENILFDEEDNAYITDFGIAKDLTGPSKTEAGY